MFTLDDLYFGCQEKICAAVDVINLLYFKGFVRALEGYRLVVDGGQAGLFDLKSGFALVSGPKEKRCQVAAACSTGAGVRL